MSPTVNDGPPDDRGGAPPVVLSIAGSDPSGGAGIQGDLKTFVAFGVYGAALPTLVTSQTTLGVRGVLELPEDFVAESLGALLSDLRPAALKIGALGSPPMVRSIAGVLAGHPSIPYVLDPVLGSTAGAASPEGGGGDRGHGLGDPEALLEDLIPRASLWTPNLPEAARFLQRPLEEIRTDPEGAADELHALGTSPVLLKGGHGEGDRCVDLLVDGEGGRRPTAFDRPRVVAPNDHGTGCALSSAIAAQLALGVRLPEAVRVAGDWLARALVASSPWRLGAGAGPPDHRMSPYGTLGLASSETSASTQSAT